MNVKYDVYYIRIVKYYNCSFSFFCRICENDDVEMKEISHDETQKQ